MPENIIERMIRVHDPSGDWYTEIGTDICTKDRSKKLVFIQEKNSTNDEITDELVFSREYATELAKAILEFCNDDRNFE